jgi:ABC-type transport system involved in cytochrome bd biosynthesis fused ATPase/permease subunit
LCARRYFTDARAGRTVALVEARRGPSTLVQLLQRLHGSPTGTVIVDGRDVRTLPPANLWRAMGVVPQEPFLFSATIGGNIAFGVDKIGVRHHQCLQSRCPRARAEPSSIRCTSRKRLQWFAASVLFW